MCFIKHISQAIPLMSEAEMGYSEHRFLAIGHMAEASDETILDYPELANMMREERLKYTECVKNVILAEAEIEIAEETKNSKKIEEAKEKLLSWKEASYKPDLMSLMRMAVLAMKETHKQSGDILPCPGQMKIDEKDMIAKPSAKFNKKDKK